VNNEQAFWLLIVSTVSAGVTVGIGAALLWRTGGRISMAVSFVFGAFALDKLLSTIAMLFRTVPIANVSLRAIGNAAIILALLAFMVYLTRK
jgi:hypothetical protein